jgi:DNA-directed RNA polymerase subunit omega
MAWAGASADCGRACSEVFYCVRPLSLYFSQLGSITNTVNSELAKKALARVGNPNVLVNLLSRRVRQLNSGGGMNSRPLIADVGNMGVADIALTEIIEDKMGWEMPEEAILLEPVSKKRKKSH